MARRLAAPLAWVGLACVLWTFRSWNLDIGDGEFCCKQTIAETAFPVTISRAPLSYWLYRSLFFTLNPLLNWWVEDIIALSSCAAGLVFFWALIRLAREAGRTPFERAAIVAFPSTTLLFQMFCGHIEFYPWTCATLMAAMYAGWKTIHGGWSPAVPSALLALAAAFHSSGVFYFPALLVLPVLTRWKEIGSWIRSRENAPAAAFFGLFVLTAVLHRVPPLFLAATVVLAPMYFLLVPPARRSGLNAWWMIYLPWFFLFLVRASFGMRAEPLLEHLPPIGEPYDHGAYLYTAFSWDHLYDKVMFHFWLAPFALPVMVLLGSAARRMVSRNRWLVFLFHASVWALVWTTLFYPQLRTRDWDLFASMSIPLNLLAVFLCLRALSPRMAKTAVPVMIVTHLTIMVPILLSNSSLLGGRGYATLRYVSEPVSADAFLRGLKLGETPVEQANIRSGSAIVRMIPHSREYLSWVRGLEIEPGAEYEFSVEFKPRPPLPPVPPPQ